MQIIKAPFVLNKQMLCAVALGTLCGHAQNPGDPPPLPLASDLEITKPTRVIVKEDTDREFTITLRGIIRSENAWMTVLSADGAVVHDAAIPQGESYSVTISKDGVVGQYALILKIRKADEIFTPLTELPGEVYPVKSWILPHKPEQKIATYFVKPTAHSEGVFRLVPGKAFFSVESLQGKVLGERGLGDISEELVEFPFPEEGVWLRLEGMYFNFENDPHLLFLSESQERWFEPSEDVLRLE